MSSTNENPASADALEEARVALAGGSRDCYIDVLAKDIAMRIHCDWTHEESRNLARLYALIGLACGANVSCQDVHDAWAVWMLYRGVSDHQSMIPFVDLAPRIQDLDVFYRDGIRKSLAVHHKLKSAEENSSELSRESSTEPVNNEPIAKAPKEEEK